PSLVPVTVCRRALRGASVLSSVVRPAVSVEAHYARLRPASTGGNLPLLRADDHPVPPVRGGAPARASLGPDRNLRNALPAVEHRGSVGPAVPPDGRAHRLHHGRAPGGAGGRGRRTAPRGTARPRGVARGDHVHAAVPARPAGGPSDGDRGVHRLALRLRPA